MRSGPLRIGQDFGPRYHVLKLLGSGGMGVVYQALDHELGEDVALKVLRAPARAAAGSLAEMQRRLRAELVLARKVTHKHVIRIHDIGEIDGIKFISMPLVKGKDLSAILGDGPLPLERALQYARQIVAGLVAVHAAGVIHRDLKPSNVMVDEDDQVLLMDFGIARPSAPSGQPRTIAGAIVGTTAYMAPEQARGEPVDQRTDVYSFGLITYEMLCGIRPNLSINELLARMKAPPTPARELNPAVPAELEAVVTRCLKPAAGDRFQTSAEVAEALADLGPRRKRRGAAATPSRAWMRRVAAVLALAAVAGLGYWMLRSPQGRRAIAQGRHAAARALDRVRQLDPASLLAREAPASAASAPDSNAPGAEGRQTSPQRQPRDRAAAAAPRVAAGSSASDASARPSGPGRMTASVGGAEAVPTVSLQAAALRFTPIAGRDARPDETIAAGGRWTRRASPAAVAGAGVAGAAVRAGPSGPDQSAPRHQREAGAGTSGTLGPLGPRVPNGAGGPSVLDLLTPALPAFRRTAGAAAPNAVPLSAHGPDAPAGTHWLDRILPLRRHRGPAPAGVEDEFQVCYIQNTD